MVMGLRICLWREIYFKTAFFWTRAMTRPAALCATEREEDR